MADSVGEMDGWTGYQMSSACISLVFYLDWSVAIPEYIFCVSSNEFDCACPGDAEWLRATISLKRNMQ